MRGLRYRLMLTYSLFFAILLIGFTGVFHARLKTQLNTQVHDSLDQEWVAMKGGIMRIEHNDKNAGKMTAFWYYDQEDPDESASVLDIRKVYMVADGNGNVIPDANGDPAESTIYEDIGIDRPADIQRKMHQALAAQRPNKPAETFWTEKRNSDRKSVV